MTNDILYLIDKKSGIDLPDAYKNIANKFAFESKQAEPFYANSNNFDFFNNVPTVQKYTSKSDAESDKNDRVQEVVKKVNEDLGFSINAGNSGTASKSKKDVVKFNKDTLNRDFLNAIHIHETGKKFGDLSDALIRGVDVGDAKGHKTYGAGLLYDPDSGRLMDDVRKELGRDFTDTELTEKFMKLYSNNINKVEEIVGLKLNQNQKEALASTMALYGHIPSSIIKAIKTGDNKKILDAWMHAHDGSSNYLKFKKGWDARSMWEALHFFGNTYESAYTDQIKKLINNYFS